MEEGKEGKEGKEAKSAIVFNKMKIANNNNDRPKNKLSVDTYTIEWYQATVQYSVHY
jgi:hypothetical protein|tara:strand:+ start:164 stop:334 length:171 start_codon:yes stop_codon:yes gene_type:complete